MKRLVSNIMVMFLLIPLTSCKEKTPITPDPEPTNSSTSNKNSHSPICEEVDFHPVDKHTNGNIDQAQNLVITDQQAFNDLSERLYGDAGQASSIDFSQSVLLAAFQGKKPTGGYEITIDHVCKTNQTVKAQVVKAKPSEGCQLTMAATQPYHLVKLSRNNLPKGFSPNQVVFDEKTVAKSCDQQNQHCNDPLGFNTIDEGGYAYGIEEAKNVVIKDQARWKAIWNKVHENDPDDVDLPAIDFQNKMIIAVFDGKHSSGGFDITIDQVCKTNNATQVNVIKEQPGSGCNVTMAITSPYQIVKVDRQSGSVDFSTTNKTRSCD